MSPGAVAVWAGVGAFCLVVYGPLLALIADAVTGASVDWGMAVPDLRRLRLLSRSAVLAGLAGFAAVGLATAVALASEGLPRALRAGRWLVLSLAVIPAYVHAQAWTSVAQTVSGRLGTASAQFSGLPAAWLVQVSAWLPLGVGLAMLAIASVPENLVEQARVSVSAPAAVRRVVLPLALPLLAVAGGLVFLLAILDYSIPALYQVAVYPLALFADFSASNQPGRALAFAVPLLLLTAGLLLVIQGRLRQIVARPPGARGPTRALSAGGSGVMGLRGHGPGATLARLIVAGLALLGLAIMAVPWIALVLQAGRPGQILGALRATGGEISYSLAVALAAAVAVLPIAGAVGLAGADSRLRVRGVLWPAILLPLAVPAPLYGIGLLALWREVPLDVYGSSAMPVLAGLARFAPVAALIVLTQARGIDSRLLDAARVHQRHRLHGAVSVGLPLLAPGLLAAGAVVFALTLGELGATLLVVPPGQGTVTLRVFNYLHYGASQTVAALGLITALLAAGAGALAVLSLSRLSAGRVE